MIALSSCSLAPLAQSGMDLIARLKNLGFIDIELGGQIGHETYIELAGAIETQGARPVSVRNYFPLPPMEIYAGQPWSLASPDRQERESAVKYSMRSLEVAGALGAGALVLSLGTIDMDGRQAELHRLHGAGGLDTLSGRRLRGALRAERENKIGAALERVKRSLEALAPAAERAGVKLGLRSAGYAHEIPSPDDLDDLLPILEPGSGGCWHDVGACAINENLGLGSQVSHFGRHRSRTIGMYLHDVSGLRDGLVPGEGDIDFNLISENTVQDVIKVLRVRPGISSESVGAGLERLASAGIS